MFGNSKNSYRNLLKETAKTLDSHLEALELLCHVGATTKDYLLTHLDDSLTPKQKQLLEDLIERRQNGEPLQYLLGEWEFYGYPLRVGAGVLIPRSDTELLVEICEQKLTAKPTPFILDLCSGSGCIAIALKKLIPSATVCAVELSSDAIVYLSENITLNQVEILSVQADVFTYQPEQSFDLIVSNPPYIPSQDLEELSLEVQQEPQLALDGGADGLSFYRMIADRYLSFLNPKGILALEIGYDQGEQVPNILKEFGYENIELFHDLSNLPRVVIANKP